MRTRKLASDRQKEKNFMGGLSYPSPLRGGWHVVSGANNMTGGGLSPQVRCLRTAVRYPHPVLRATLPARGRDKEETVKPSPPSSDTPDVRRSCSRAGARRRRWRARRPAPASASLASPRG